VNVTQAEIIVTAGLGSCLAMVSQEYLEHILPKGLKEEET
jgi:chemotaxis receptor (MCP) glutamine deamidase CheD